MSIIRINRDPSPRQLAVFAATWLAFFALLGAIPALREAWAAAAMSWTAAAVVPAVGWPFPALLRWSYLAMCYLAFPVGFCVSHAVLAFVYFGAIAPIGLAMRAVGYDPLQRRFDRAAPSYWIPRGPAATADRYFRQS